MQVAEQLASANINIAHFSLGRRDKGKMAMGALVLDTPIPESILTGLGKYADLKNVVQVMHSSHSLSRAHVMCFALVSCIALQVRLSQIVDPNFRVRSATQQGVVFGSSKPFTKPKNPEFSSGPCKKRPGYSLSNLKTDSLGKCCFIYLHGVGQSNPTTCYY